MDTSECTPKQPFSLIGPNNNIALSASKIPAPPKLLPPFAVKRTAPDPTFIEVDMKRAKVETVALEKAPTAKKHAPSSTLARTKSLASITSRTNQNMAPTSRGLQGHNSRTVGNPGMKSATSFSSVASATKMEITKSTSNLSMLPPMERPKPKRLPTDIKGRLEDLEKNLGSQSRENKELEKRLTDLENMNKYLNETVASKETVNLAVSQQLEDVLRINREKDCNFEDATVKYNQQIIELENQKGTMLREMQRLRSDLEASYAENSGLKVAIAELSSAQAGISIELSTCKAENDKLRSSVEHYKTENGKQKLEIEELNAKLRTDEQIRRQMHNTIQELKGNIRVFCRARPILPDSDGEICSLKFTDPEEKCIEIIDSSNPKRQQSYQFSFDRVFVPTSTQEVVFAEISQLVQSALDGYNVCIFAYGQTGSGKTYTMEGPPGATPSNGNDIGMISRAITQIFSTAQMLSEKGWTYTMEAAFLEIYNETLRNLLDDDNNKKYEIRLLNNHSSEIYVTNLDPIVVKSESEVHSLMMRAQSNRSIAATKCNERSSRSHYIFQLKLTGKNNITGTSCQGTLHLVDLAGSERVKESGSQGDRLSEAKNINKSLSNLGNVIMALSQNGSHIPYRNSKLTFLLMNSLGGNSKTLMFVNISPHTDDVSETLNSLRFAAKVNQCNIGTVRKNL